MSIASDRELGLMVGVAAGNLLGLPVEGELMQDIQESFPDGIHDLPVLPGLLDDDDLAQSIIIANAAARGPLDSNDLARRFWEWGELNGLGMGGLTYEALALYGGCAPSMGASEAREPAGLPVEEASRTAWAGRSAGNGALMRCAPIAIRWRDDEAALVRNSIVSAVPTHWDSRCGWSCALLNLAVAAALRGETTTADALVAAAEAAVRPSLPELSRYGYEAIVPGSVREAVAIAAESEIGDIAFDGANMGFTLLTLQAALISLWRTPDFERGLRAVVEAGGDTDTNGAAAGAALGARFGLEAIPQRWRDSIAQLRNGRPTLEACAEAVAAARPAP